MNLSWLNLTEIILQLITCWVVFQAGKWRGVTEIIELLLEKKILKEEDIRKLEQ